MSYRVCLVDDELAQLSLWQHVDTDGRVAWTDKELFLPGPTRVDRLLVHESAMDAVAIAHLDAALTLRKGNAVELQLDKLRTRSS